MARDGSDKSLARVRRRWRRRLLLAAVAALLLGGLAGWRVWRVRSDETDHRARWSGVETGYSHTSDYEADDGR